MGTKRAWKRKRRTKRSKRKSLMASNIGPWLVILGIIVAVGAAGFTVVRFVLPPALSLFGIEWPPSTPAPPTPTPIPTPTPRPAEAADLAELQSEIVPPDSAKYVSDPMRFGDEIIYTGGNDETGPRNDRLYIYNMSEHASAAVNGIVKEFDDFFQPQLNENWILWLDQKRGGGGRICVMNRQSSEIFTVKEYYVGQPKVTLAGGRVCWTERTGSRMDKVFLYDLASRENVCLAMFENMVFGQSDCHMSGNEVVWADIDTVESNESMTDAKGAIHSVALDESGGEMQRFSAGTYVHDPQTNGTDRVWSDANHGEHPNLYLSIGGGVPRQIAEDVAGYGIGSNFVAYVQNEQVHIYAWGEREFERVISMEGERCIFAGVSDETVFWFQTGVSAEDVVKYAVIS